MYHLGIRDWLWLTALVAMGLAWWADRQSYQASRRLMYAKFQDMQNQTEGMRRAMIADRKRYEASKLPQKSPRYSGSTFSQIHRGRANHPLAAE